MSKMSLSGDLKVFGEQYHEATALADASAGVAGTVIDTGTGGQSGGICIKAVANGAIAIAALKKMTLTINEGEASDDLDAKLSIEVAGEKAIADKALIFDYVLPPSIKRFTSVTVTCNDGDATGAVAIYPTYLPR